MNRQKKINLTIFDMTGKQVKVMVNQTYPSGSHSLTWNGTDGSGRQMGSGIYFYVLKADDQVIGKKMIYTR